MKNYHDFKLKDIELRAFEFQIVDAFIEMFYDMKLKIYI